MELSSQRKRHLKRIKYSRASNWRRWKKWWRTQAWWVIVRIGLIKCKMRWCWKPLLNRATPLMNSSNKLVSKRINSYIQLISSNLKKTKISKKLLKNLEWKQWLCNSNFRVVWEASYENSLIRTKSLPIKNLINLTTIYKWANKLLKTSNYLFFNISTSIFI